MAQLVFEIKNQWISRTDTFKPVAKSKNYLYAQFNFLTDEWVGVPTAIFRNKTSAYEQIIGQDGTCLVPWEVIDVEGDSEIFVSVFCGDLVTANKARVHVYDTGYGDDLKSDTPPTPSVYEQILNRMAGIEEDMDNATQRAESAAESAEYAAEHYPIIMDEYWYVWDVIEHEYVDTNIKAEAHDGTSATVEVEQIVGGHRVIITDASGEHIFDVPDGRDGTDGRGIASLEKTSTSGDIDQYTMTFSDGSEPFIYYVTNGASATISTRAITNGYRLTITDKNGTRAIDVLNGAKGDPGNGIQSINKIGSYENYDYYEIRMTNGNKTSFTVTNGYSPTVEIVNITGGHRVIITDTNGAHSFDVMDGAGGGGVAIHICSSTEYDHTTGVPTIQNPEENTFYLVPSSESTTHDMFVEWVYVNNAWEMFGSASIDLSNYATKTELNTKVDKVTGKGLSTNDYTTEEKNKLAGIEAHANKTVVDDALSSTSTNPVQNKKVKEALDNLDAGDIAYDDEETYSEGSVGDGLGSLKADINQLEDALNVKEGARYGVIGIGQKSAALSRLWDAAGMRAQVGTDGDNSSVVNDFDHALPFMRRKCVGYWSSENGNAVFHVNAYEGENGYAEDGTAGDYVAVECPKCYYYFDGNILGISAHKYEGWRAFDIFTHDHNPNQEIDYYYRPAYDLCLDNAGHAVCLPGYCNAQGSYKALMDAARTYKNGDLGTLPISYPMALSFYEWALFTIEFATQNCQSVMFGCGNLRSNSSDVVTFFGDTTHALVNNWRSDRVVGMYVTIVAANRDVHHANDLATHKVLSLTRVNSSGTPDSSGTYTLMELQDLGRNYYTYDTTGETEYHIGARPYITGVCNTVSTPSGSPVNNTNGYYPMKYRHAENIYGNQYKTTADFFGKRVGTGDSDYYLEYYYLLSPQDYTPSSSSKPDATDLATDAFAKLGIETAHENYVNGYIKSKKYDVSYPDIWIPYETEGASASTFFADYASLVTSYAVRSVRLFGYWSSGSYAGLSLFFGSNAPSTSYAYYGGSLCFPQ